MNSHSNGDNLSRKEREFLARRQEILDAATRLFAAKGYHGTAMSEIAKEAEFSTGSLYNFFKNKEELYFTLLREKIEALQEELVAVYGIEGKVEDKLRRFVEITLSYFERERYFFRIFMERRSEFQISMKGEFSEVIFQKYEEYLGNMVKLMEEGVSEGAFKALDPVELALIFLGVLNTFIFVSVNTEADYQLKDKGETILEIFFNGIRR